jgi:hypothetical protein
VGRAAALAAHLGLPAGSIYWLVGPLPRLASGKPDLTAIRQRAAADVASRDTAAAGTGGIAAIFAESFPGVDIGPEDSFASLGGDSLSYVNFSIALEACIGEAPDGWERLSLAELEGMARAHTGGQCWLRRVDSDVVVRAGAICSIVGLHAGAFGSQGLSVGAGGGAIMLMTLFGYNMARFQRDILLSADRWQPLWRFASRVIAPYYAILIAYLLYKQVFDPAALLLVSNYQGRFGNVVEPFWFLEASVQALAAMVLILAVPPVQRLAKARPTAFAAALVAGALALKGAGALLLTSRSSSSARWMRSLPMWRSAGRLG